ncbi:MAG: alpha/beta hydrolase [Flavobacteriaceae bacterium]|nr:alpha/beta hydrolase [Bacteroidia bacterium]NNK87437.1 alpha/beta hydrolase [Flavobacteriaceae bacterium]
MNQELIHVYLMPGMAANPSIFEYIDLPTDRFKIHRLEWIIPHKQESLTDYALRMCGFVDSSYPVLVGVSFGGILVQEMSKHISIQKLIIISSVKSRKELPRRMKLARQTKGYKLIPTQLASKLDMLARFAYGDIIKKRFELYKKYLSISDPAYLNWALEQLLNWEQTEPPAEIIHIHGEKDGVFPVRYLDDYISIKNGTHLMILNRYKWFNRNLPGLILS